jgi:trehalose 6-phosphate phosphatase
VHALEGKKVLELSVRPLGKGAALARLRAEAGATGTLMVGDDVTDEDAFAVLADGGPTVDVTVKVGSGDTRAVHRVGGPEHVLALLRHLVTTRAGGPSQRRDAGAPGE